jgi:hypothetical protein
LKSDAHSGTHPEHGFHSGVATFAKQHDITSKASSSIKKQQLRNQQFDVKKKY